jgi:hypothetical protein
VELFYPFTPLYKTISNVKNETVHLKTSLTFYLRDNRLKSVRDDLFPAMLVLLRPALLLLLLRQTTPTMDSSVSADLKHKLWGIEYNIVLSSQDDTTCMRDYVVDLCSLIQTCFKKNFGNYICQLNMSYILHFPPLKKHKMRKYFIKCHHFLSLIKFID